MKNVENKKIFFKEINLLDYKFFRGFTELEYELLPFVNGWFFLEKYFRDGNNWGLTKEEIKNYLFTELQLLFKKNLDMFMKTDDKIFSRFIKNRIFYYLFLRKVLLDFKWPDKIDNPFSLDDNNKLMIELYRDLKYLSKKINLETQRQTKKIGYSFNYQKYKKYGWQYKSIDFLRKEIKTCLKEDLLLFMVHGSFATRDFIDGWSDLDSLLILRNSFFKNPNSIDKKRKKIRKLSLICHKIDPLAHHKIFFLTEFDLKHYSPLFLPLSSYSHSLYLNGEKKLYFKIRDDSLQKFQRLISMLDNFRNKIDNQNYSETLFNLKQDLSEIMLWPSLILQAKNIYLYKRESFERVKKEFPKLDFKIIDQISILRKNWQRSNIFKYYPNLFFKWIPFWVNRGLLNKYRSCFLDKLTLPIGEKKIKEYTQESLTLMEKSFRKVLEEIKYGQR